MMKRYMKTVMPFALTLLVGLSIGTGANLFRRAGNESAPVPTKTLEPQADTHFCYSDIEVRALGSIMTYGLGSSHHEAIRVEFERQPPEIEEQYLGAKEIVSRDNKLKDAKILNLPAPGYWTEEHDFKHCHAVILRATLDSSGEVTEISPAMPAESAEHSQSVIAAARQIRFAPAVDEYGRKTPQKVAIVYQY